MYHFFWGGPLSNWHESPFTTAFSPIKRLEKPTTFNCVEQYMMANKALCFNDEESFNAIMNTNSPREQKRLGRLVNGFDAKVWDAISSEVVFYGCLCKFSYHEDLRDLLLGTYPDLLVEASPTDRIWGIGYSEKDALNNIDDWGINKLGLILTDVRNIITGVLDTKIYKMIIEIGKELKNDK
jgi:ribA/ribD-fused uncharacterized protein